MKRTYIKDLTEGEHLIKGYVETIRDKKIMFLVIRDVTGFVQVTIEKDNPTYDEAKKLTPHSFCGDHGQVRVFGIRAQRRQGNLPHRH